MIYFIHSPGHRYTTQALERDRTAPKIKRTTYDRIIGARKFERATYIFGDLDRLSPHDLELAGRLYLLLKNAGLRVLNNPARVKLRYSLLRTLHREGLNDFNVYPAEELPETIRYPVYVRRWRSHGWPSSDLLETRAQVEEAVAKEVANGVTADSLIVVEYVGEPVMPGIYRKQSAFRIGDAITPYLCGHDTKWIVKVGTLGCADQALYDEEYRLIRENPHAETLRRVFDLAEIEYGRLDFGFYQGRLQFFEINTNPHLPAPSGEHPFPVRVQSMNLAYRQIVEKFHPLDSLAGPAIHKKDALLKRYRWSRFFHRSRPMG